MKAERAVLDTNVLISAAIQPLGPSRRVLVLLRDDGSRLVFSEPTLHELRTWIMRPKFGRYLSEGSRLDFLAALAAMTDLVPIRGLPMGCRDPEDDKVIETALLGRAEVIVTGDEDLLAMPARPEFRVLTPRGFLDGVG